MTTAQIPAAGEIDAIVDWLLQQGMFGDDIATLLQSFGERLNAAGVRLWRGHLAIATLHPAYSALGFTWRRDKGLLAEQYDHRDEVPMQWRQSPLRRLIEERIPSLRLRLHLGEGLSEHPVLVQFRAEGATDWLGTLVEFGGAGQPAGIPGMACSWASDREGGFTDADLQAIERLLPALGLVVFRMVLMQVATTLLQTYTGGDAGRRILSGQIKRGAVERISAVICIADIRGFTGLADRAEGQELLGWLNDYLGAMTDAVEAVGGQVLKFLGDGLLAVFPLQDRRPAEVCGQAVAAVTAARAVFGALDQRQAAAGAPPLELDIALHLGEVLYGNVGSTSRLDFTVIGPAVNEASRIEALCAPLDRTLLMSAAFAAAWEGPSVSLGFHRLRGIETPQELFTLP